jgi:hypothetical protein
MQSKPVLRIRDVYPVSRIRIPDPKTERGEKKFVVLNFYVATNFTKLKVLKKKFGQIFSKNYRTFYPKKLSLSSQKYGFGIRDPGSGKNLFKIPDPGVKKAPDPRSGSATLNFNFNYIVELK